MIPLKDLNLTSRFLFDEVMEDPQTHQDALSIIFGKDIPLLERTETEKELRDFLHYLEDTTDQRAAASNSDRIKRIHDRVRKVKLNEEAGVRYMQAWEERYYDREEARNEGLAEGLAEGREQGISLGEQKHLIKMVCKKLKKNYSVSEIADMLEEEESTIQTICNAMEEFAPDYDLDTILGVLLK